MAKKHTHLKQVNAHSILDVRHGCETKQKPKIEICSTMKNEWTCLIHGDGGTKLFSCTAYGFHLFWLHVAELYTTIFMANANFSCLVTKSAVGLFSCNSLCHQIDRNFHFHVVQPKKESVRYWFNKKMHNSLFESIFFFNFVAKRRILIKFRWKFSYFG